MDEPRVQPSAPAFRLSIVLVLASAVAAGALDGGGAFKPRVPTVDALAGLFVGAFFVDRLLTFVPPSPLRATPAERAADVNILRWGYGAVLGALFVILTDLRAVDALAGDTYNVSPFTDRFVAVLAIAGGTVGLSRLVSALKPPAPVAADAVEPADANRGAPAERDADEVAPPAVVVRDDDAPLTPVPPPSDGSRLIGLGAVVIAALVALWPVLKEDDEGIELLGKGAQGADGTVEVIVRFGLVILMAAIIEQAIERTPLGADRPETDKKVVTGAASLVLAVAFVRFVDLYLLHNLGFFTTVGVEDEINDRLVESSDAELWFDTFVTAAVVAAGTRPLHDLASRLRKATPTKN